MSFEWPEHPVGIAEASRLFSAAGKPMHRTALARFMDSRRFPFVEGARRAKLVDAKALFEAMTTDFTRSVQSGETGHTPQSYSAAPRAPAAPPDREPGDDPKFRQAQIKVIESELDLAERLNQTVPAAEVTAGAGEAIASLRSAFAEARADAVSRILQLFGRPESDARLVREELKRFERAGQEKFAAAFAAFLTPDGHTEAAARDKLARAAEIAEALDADPQS